MPCTLRPWRLCSAQPLKRRDAVKHCLLEPDLAPALARGNGTPLGVFQEVRVRREVYPQVSWTTTTLPLPRLLTGGFLLLGVYLLYLLPLLSPRCGFASILTLLRIALILVR